MIAQFTHPTQRATCHPSLTVDACCFVCGREFRGAWGGIDTTEPTIVWEGATPLPAIALHPRCAVELAAGLVRDASEVAGRQEARRRASAVAAMLAGLEGVDR